MKPAPVAVKKPVEKPRPPVANPESVKAADKQPAAGDKSASAEPTPQKPLVPVTQVSMSNGPADGATIGTLIRRLPPVEPTDPNVVNRAAALSAGTLDSGVSDYGNRVKVVFV